MDLAKKLEEIRQKPESVRIRYVWGSVAVSMLIIVIIWIFSLEESFKNIKTNDLQTMPDLKQNIDDLKSIKDSLPSIKDAPGSLSGEGIQNNTVPTGSESAHQ